MVRRVAVIDKFKCINGKGCNLVCAKYCPVNRSGGECVTENPIDNKPVIDEKLCIGCLICAHRCPVGAIKVVNLPDKLEEDPVIRFGKNSFELFRLPIPKFGKVVGILGRNGIGKTTALEILAGTAKINFGKYDLPPSDQDILDHFSNDILGMYFKKLFNQKVRVSYKPQRIELIPKVYSGKVMDLLKKVDEKGLAEKYVELLEVSHLKDRGLDKLSGGELQKIAIIAAAVKKAEVYYFDEPASFCDITTRIKVARLIRSLADKDTAVMVVEHDLATLDYISDEIQIFYGERSVFGVVSQSKSVRRGINEYLDGYLPDDNVRFRDYSIKFEDLAGRKVLSSVINFSYEPFEKSFETFSLKVNSGEVHKGEILAVMGPNGLGKTTFLNILAGKLKPDKGDVESQKISYKVQYPQAIDSSVRDFIYSIAAEKLSSGWYKQNLLEKLGLKEVLDNDVQTLSGGELQKVFIAATLLEDCDLYVFDEPSAFIDVEDRLKVAEIIRDFVIRKEVSAIVVDHDVQFVDKVADSMLVFKGEPGKHGEVVGPLSKKDGMNEVLKMLDITYRRDKATGRPRINKPGSQLDKTQRAKGQYYYTE